MATTPKEYRIPALRKVMLKAYLAGYWNARLQEPLGEDDDADMDDWLARQRGYDFIKDIFPDQWARELLGEDVDD